MQLPILNPISSRGINFTPTFNFNHLARQVIKWAMTNIILTKDEYLFF